MFSPDGQTVAFWTGRILKRIDIRAAWRWISIATVWCPTVVDDKGIMFSQWGTGIVRVARERALGRRPIDETAGRRTVPAAADGRTILPCSTSGPTTAVGTVRVVVNTARVASARRSSKAERRGKYRPGIVCALKALFARAFDLATLNFTGGAVPVIEACVARRPR
jgi:hypothetical protein